MERGLDLDLPLFATALAGVEALDAQDPRLVEATRQGLLEGSLQAVHAQQTARHVYVR